MLKEMINKIDQSEESWKEFAEIIADLDDLCYEVQKLDSFISELKEQISSRQVNPVKVNRAFRYLSEGQKVQVLKYIAKSLIEVRYGLDHDRIELLDLIAGKRKNQLPAKELA